MKLKVIIGLLFTLTTCFSQKQALNSAAELLKNNNYSEAKQRLFSIYNIENSEDKFQEQYYLLMAELYYELAEESVEAKPLLLSSGRALLNFKQINKKSKSAFAFEANDLLEKVSQKIIDVAILNQKEKKYIDASDLLFLNYSLYKDKPDFLYFAASNSITGKDYDTALKYYEILKELKYTGNSDDSRLPEIIKNISWIYVNHVGDKQKGLIATEEALVLSPNDESLLLTKASIYYSLGNTEKFLEILNSIIKINPNSIDSYYNIGVVNIEGGNIDLGRKAYEKVLEIDPKYLNASINLSKTYLDEAGSIVEKMGELGTSKTDNTKFEDYQKKQIELYKKSTLILEKALQYHSNNASVLSQLKGLYSFLGNDKKFEEVKTKLENLGH